MSLRWTLYVLLTPPPPRKGDSQMQHGHFSSKIALHLKKICYKVSVCEYCQFIYLYKKWSVEDITYYGKIWPKLTNPLHQRRIPISIRLYSAITPSDKSSVNTNKKPTVSFPKSLRWKSYVAPKPPPQKGAQNAVSKIWQVICDNFKTVQDRMSVTDTITDRKSHTGFRLVPTLMTLNDLERRNSPYFAFFSPNAIALQADYLKVVEDRPIMSAKYRLPVTFGLNWPTIAVARSLATAELLVFIIFIVSSFIIMINVKNCSLYKC